jgi:hypothetical protein
VEPTEPLRRWSLIFIDCFGENTYEADVLLGDNILKSWTVFEVGDLISMVLNGVTLSF